MGVRCRMGLEEGLGVWIDLGIRGKGRDKGRSRDQEWNKRRGMIL